MEIRNNATHKQFSQKLLHWFQHYGRTNLPWQQNQTSYRVWLSEIMLQQTQVKTVIPYYEKFTQTFPTIKQLALAPEDEVLHLWTGLGYYARARNLHKTAKIIHQKHDDKFPDTVAELCELPGIGKSTAGAVISLSTQQRAVILDGNVKRVLCRYHCIAGWPDKPSVQKQLWQIAEQYTPTKKCAQYTQAIMDLGATLCTRAKPACPICPLHENCQAYKANQISEFPNKKPKKVIPVKSTYMMIFHFNKTGKILLEKRPSQGIWGGLWSFPETDNLATASHDLLTSTNPQQLWPPIRHTFSHFHLDITPVIISVEHAHQAVMENNRLHWYDLQKPSKLGLAAPVKKLLSALEKNL